MPKPLEPETRIGGYELVRRIGAGGMAEVWVARRVSERRANKYVAIKVVADQHVGDSRFHRMFRTEVELSALLNHVNIVQVFDEGEDDGRSYLVMEWVDGVNLLKVEAALTFVDDEAWRLRVITYIVGQLLYALHYAHSITHDGSPLGIVHRDVSPQNVLVSAQGEVKLTDFGVAHYLLEESSGVHVKGKLRYMAPEQLAGKTRDPRLDLYAVGAILHELLDGRRFRYDVEDQRDMYIEVISGKIPTLSRRVPPELDALRLGLLEPDPARRIPSADAALEWLARFPGYGDARRELAQLCGGLTGVMRPRVGPGRFDEGSSVGAVPSAGAVPVEASRVVSPADAGALGASVVAGAGDLPVVRAKTLRVEGGAAASPPPARLEPTQPWQHPAVPAVVASSGSAPIHVANEITDPVSPVTAPMAAGFLRDDRSRRIAMRSPAPWAVGGTVVALLLLGAGSWWWVVERPRREGSDDTVASHALPAQATSSNPVSVGANEPSPTASSPPPPPSGDVGANGAGVQEPEANARTGDVAGDAKAKGTSDDGGDAEAEATSGEAARDAQANGANAAPGKEPAAPATDARATTDAKPADDGGTKPSGPTKSAPRPKQALSLVAVAALGTVEVEVRSREGSLRKTYELRGQPRGSQLPVGGYTVRWRPVGASQWSKSERVELRRGCDLRIVIEAKGVKPIPMGSGCR